MMEDGREISSVRSMALLMLHLRRYAPRRLPVVLAAGFFSALMEGVGLFLIIVVATRLLIPGQIAPVLPEFLEFVHVTADNIYLIAGLVAFAILLRIWGSIWAEIQLKTLATGFIKAFRVRLFGAIERCDWSYLKSLDTASHISALSLDAYRVGDIVAYALRAIVRSMFLAVQLVLAFVVAPKLAAMMVLVLLVWLPFGPRLIREAASVGQKIPGIYENIVLTIRDFVTGVPTTRMAGTEEEQRSAFTDAIGAQHDVVLRFARLESVSRGLFQSATAVTLVLALIAGAVLLPESGVMVLFFMALVVRIFPLAVALFSEAQHAFLELGTFKRLMRMAEDLEAHSEGSAQSSLGRALRPENSIALNNVSYRPAGGSRQILKDLSLTIPTRCVTVLIGPSGAGKSTVGEILTGLLRSSSGNMLIDGIELSDQDRGHWRRQVGYIQQTTPLRNGTILENLIWTAPDKGAADIERALKSAGAWEFVNAFEDGLDTAVGEHGKKLSGGERQRIALARELLRDPNVIILDEGTSSLDRRNLDHIYRALTELKSTRTIVLITHDSSALEIADHVCIMESGRLSMEGSPWALDKQGYNWRGIVTPSAA